MLIRAKLFFSSKIQFGYKTRRISCWFKIRWKSKKTVPKKVISKNAMEICTFSAFTHVRQTCFAFVTFFGAFFKNIFNLKSAWNFVSFDTFFDLYFFQTLKPNAQKKAPPKSKNLISKWVLDLKVAPIRGSVFLFLKKVKFVVPQSPVVTAGGSETKRMDRIEGTWRLKDA